MIEGKTGAPKDYAELYEHYFPMIRSIVAKAGIASAEVEDVSMDLLTKFMEKDALTWYDPELLHDVGKHPRLEGERKRPAKFQGLLRSFCTLYVRQHLDRQNLRAKREPHHLEDQVGESTWGEVHADRHSDEPHLAIIQRDSLQWQMHSALDLLEAESHEWQSVARVAPTRQAQVHASRRSAEASRARQALITATDMAQGNLHYCQPPAPCRCERITATGIAKLNGWSTSTASQALKTAQAQLRPAANE